MHLAAEAKIGGPVHYRWMYPIERYLGRLKSYRREEELEVGCTTEQARADASADRTQPPAMRRERGLTVVEVGEGNGRSRQSVQEELDAAFAADQARGDASDDDETQPPDDVVQETPASNNLRKKRGNTLLTRIWSLPPNMKIESTSTAHLCQLLGRVSRLATKLIVGRKLRNGGSLTQKLSNQLIK
ncbi:hypothetical protein CMV_012977 [Castanea mollissima]|uniref:DUF4218 domain-containing protein n=1 Tax=Castanea mollissima TaxID=60419 RepID=A0A8J4REB2_9ROSI|nr:hypothetical protein CMV_012977 [Castanea mollissima]